MSGDNLFRSPGFTVLAFAVFLLAILADRSHGQGTPITLLGPTPYVQDSGPPSQYSTPFTLQDAGPPFVLHLVNGDEMGHHRLSSVVVEVNGTVVVHHQDLNQNVAILDVPLAGLLPANTVNVHLASGPGGFITLAILGTSLVPNPPELNPFPTATNSGTVTVSGTALGAVVVEVSAPTGIFTVPVTAGGFTADVPLEPNHLNHLYFTGIGSNGVRGAPTPASVIHDGQPPVLFIDFPPDGATLTNAAIDVAGRVSDTLSGFMGLNVIVNGVPAIVDVGIGTNGTFLAANVPLTLTPSPTPTVLTAIASDQLGNTATRQISVTRVPLSGNQMLALSGNAQSGPVGGLLPLPIVVRVSHANGTPFAMKTVTFRVTRSNGRLTADGTGEGSLTFQDSTDLNGEAAAYWRLGSDAGCGNNRVEVTSQDINGTVFFCASATPGPPKQINIGSGNNQRGETGSPAPEPLRVWVNDGCNGISGISVTFTVLEGSGSVNGQLVTTVTTGETGHAAVMLRLGPQPVSNVIGANFPGNPTAPVLFNALGRRRNPLVPTWKQAP
jgi:hypothetical protein